MIWIVALLTGVLLGLLYFGGLWVTVRLVLHLRRQALARRRQWVGLLSVSRLARLGLLGLTFYALGRAQAGYALATLPGFWLARWYMIRHLGGVRHASD